MSVETPERRHERQPSDEIFCKRFGIRPYRILAGERDAEILAACQADIDVIIADIHELFGAPKPVEEHRRDFHRVIHAALGEDPREEDMTLMGIAEYVSGMQAQWRPGISEAIAMKETLLGGERHIREIHDRTVQANCVDIAAIAGHLAQEKYGIEGEVRKVGMLNIHHYWEETRESGAAGAVIDPYYARKSHGFARNADAYAKKRDSMYRAWKKLNIMRAKRMIREKILRLPPGNSDA